MVIQCNIRSIAERKKADEVRWQSAAANLAAAEAEERYRVARQIHDTVIQDLALASMRLGAAADATGRAESRKALAELATARLNWETATSVWVCAGDGRVIPHGKRFAHGATFNRVRWGSGRNGAKGAIVMKTDLVRILGVVAVVGAVAGVGCSQKSESEQSKTGGIAERTGAALDRAAEKTVEAAKTTGSATKDVAGQAVEKTADVASTVADKTVEAAKATGTATKDVAGQVVEKTGEVLEKAGAAVEQAGADMQK